MNKPIAVLISDVHYDLSTLEVADAAMKQAILRANTLKVPLIDLGDLTNNKANLRAEVVNRLLETFKLAHTKPYLLVGNHSKINEKSEDHALNFLKQVANVIDYPQMSTDIEGGVYFIPYQHDLRKMKDLIRKNPPYYTIICHQGIKGSSSGEYMNDNTALTIQDPWGSRARIISGHYHTRQTIDLPNGGKWDYVGNPFSLNFGEASDPEKGFQILMSDGSLEFVPTNLRKHVVIDITQGWNETDYKHSSEYKPGDILKVKYHCNKEHSQGVTKNLVKRLLDLDHTNFRLELLPTDNQKQQINENLTQHEILDQCIDQLDASSDLKSRLKQTWRQM